MPKQYIKIRGANEHNLKNISVDIPRDELVVLTGLSGSGKSSLAFDTIYAEGQRRYMESLSSYARQFLGQMEKPEVESIEGLSPAISIDQKSTNRNPRSTVGTVTEIYDYMRLLYARIGIPHCPKCGREIHKQTTVQNWFSDHAKAWNRQALFTAVWNQDTDALTREMNDLLRMTISYHDYREDFYHAFLAGIFAGAGYMVESNKEHGEGRSDVIVTDPRGGKVAVFEAKHSKNLENLERDCEAALDQIDEKMYAKEFEDSYDQVNCYGIAFFKKRCLVRGK